MKEISEETERELRNYFNSDTLRDSPPSKIYRDRKKGFKSGIWGTLKIDSTKPPFLHFIPDET